MNISKSNIQIYSILKNIFYTIINPNYINYINLNIINHNIKKKLINIKEKNINNEDKKEYNLIHR